MSTISATLPTIDQLKAYAERMPAVYRDIIMAIRGADPYRRVNEGVLYHAVLNTMRGRAGAGGSGHGSGGYEYYYSPEEIERRRIDDPDRIRGNNITDAEFDLALDRLAELGFIQDPDSTPFGSVVPTELGEHLIAAVTGAPTFKVPLPDLPKPNW